MLLNVKKTVCMRIGKRFNEECCSLSTLGGKEIHWANHIRYLGVHILSARKFKLSLSDNLKAYYRSVNVILTKLANCASKECSLKLLYSKCVPVLIYGIEACDLS